MENKPGIQTTIPEPYLHGFLSGSRDRKLGYRSEYAWFLESFPGYTRSYSLGYRAGWNEVDRNLRETEPDTSRLSL